ncbi:hypothetical protein LADH09A_002343 [Micromonospora sp. LAH09]|nr:hypothetical protein [Micromonospora cabrerizensis]
MTALLALVGCTGPDTTVRPAPASPPATAAVRLVEEQQADLHLWVSNQSFADDSVVLRVSIDGTGIVDQHFAVEHQHNWFLFPVRVPPGLHVVRVVSNTGVEIQETFTMPETGRQYAAVDYGNPAHGGARHVNWFIRSTPIAFA